MIGSTNFTKSGSILDRINFLRGKQDINKDNTDIKSIISACSNMSISKTGVLIVIERSNNLDFLENSGDKMNLTVNQPILESIFFKNSPLHDGAIIISNNIVKATRVVLPINNEKVIPNRYGLRHRAAVSITEKTDCLAIVVSEESGQISYIKNGKFVNFRDSEDLVGMIKKDLY
jgi:DNA integrity scanning protein DisA with diadenylate cyclase activity